MTENVNSDSPTPIAAAAPAPSETKVAPGKYPAMNFVVQFAKLAATVIAVLFLVFAVFSLGTGIFTEASFAWGMINAGFYILIGSVLVGLVRGMGEMFELMLELEKRK